MTNIRLWVQQTLTRRRLIWIGAGVLLVLLLVASWLTFRPQTLAYHYGGDSCDRRLLLFPGTVSSVGERYRLEPRGGLSLGATQVTSTEICAVALKAPAAHQQASVQLRAMGGVLPVTEYTIHTSDLPQITSELDAPISAKQPLKLALSAPDATFTYALVAGEKRAACTVKERQVVCPVAELNLTQGEQQVITVERLYKQMVVDTPLKKQVRLQAPARIVSSSVTADSVVYDTPKSIAFQVDKPIVSAEATLERIPKDGEGEKIATTTKTSNTEIIVQFTDDLPRKADYRLTLDVTARDGSSLVAPLSLPFKTSGGPAVTGISVGSSGYIPGSPITITFDQPLKADMPISQFVNLKDMTGTIAIRGAQVVITPQAIGRCATFGVAVKKGIVSEHGIASESDWSTSSRARCYTTETIGTSVNGRPITAYFFGNGGSYVLYTGAIHGNEQSSKYLTQNWISELDARAGEIPGSKTLVVVPIVNPDGTAIGGRNNARGVNLNRNFPTHNWEKDIITSGGRQAGEGGESAGSEPETQALMRLTQRLNPAFVVTFHSSGALVNSNDAGNSVAKGQQYASLAGYSFIPNSATTGTFGFEMTGTYEDWLLERGTAAILIELNTNTGNHFSQNRAALWSTMK